MTSDNRAIGRTHKCPCLVCIFNVKFPGVLTYWQHQKRNKLSKGSYHVISSCVRIWIIRIHVVFGVVIILGVNRSKCFRIQQCCLMLCRYNQWWWCCSKFLLSPYLVVSADTYNCHIIFLQAKQYTNIVIKKCLLQCIYKSPRFANTRIPDNCVLE